MNAQKHGYHKTFKRSPATRENTWNDVVIEGKGQRLPKQKKKRQEEIKCTSPCSCCWPNALVVSLFLSFSCSELCRDAAHGAVLNILCCLSRRTPNEGMNLPLSLLLSVSSVLMSHCSCCLLLLPSVGFIHYHFRMRSACLSPVHTLLCFQKIVSLCIIACMYCTGR